MRILVLALLFVASPSSYAHEIKIGDLVIVHPMVDEAKKGQAESRGSLEIRNEETPVVSLFELPAVKVPRLFVYDGNGIHSNV